MPGPPEAVPPDGPPLGVHWLVPLAAAAAEPTAGWRCLRCGRCARTPGRFSRLAFSPCGSGPGPQWLRVPHLVSRSAGWVCCRRCGGACPSRAGARFCRSACPARQCVWPGAAGEVPDSVYDAGAPSGVDWGRVLWAWSGRCPAGGPGASAQPDRPGAGRARRRRSPSPALGAGRAPPAGLSAKRRRVRGGASPAPGLGARPSGCPAVGTRVPAGGRPASPWVSA